MARLFIGINLAEEEFLREQSENLRKILAESRISWVEPENFHITLIFLGELSSSQIPFIHRILCDSAISSKPFTLSIEKPGYFGHIERPSVIWMGYKLNPELKHLERLISYKLLSPDIGYENQKFKPHLTLGRVKTIKEKKNFADFVSLERPFPKLNKQIKEFQLFQSFLDKNGAVYKILYNYRLEGS